MYTLTIQTTAANDRTEEEFFFATAQDAYGKVAEMAAALAAEPTDVIKTFTVRPMKGSLPVDAKI